MDKSNLYPIETAARGLRALSGIWMARADLRGEGELCGWQNELPAPLPMALPADFREIFTEAAACAVWCEREVFVPRAWAERELLLCCTVAGEMDVWANGAVIARGAGGAVRLPLGSAAVCGETCRLTLAVRGTVVTAPVLTALPREALTEITVRTTFGGGAGTLFYTAKTTNGHAPLIELLDASGAVVAGECGAGGELRVPNAALWEPEKPCLYTLRATLGGGTRPTDEYLLPVGIRTVEARDSRVLINRRPFYLKGFVRREDSPLCGAGYSAATLARDFSLLRWVGANAVLAAGVSEEFLRLADRTGLLVIDASGGDAAAGAMLARDRNHPCVVLWRHDAPVDAPPADDRPRAYRTDKAASEVLVAEACDHAALGRLARMEKPIIAVTQSENAAAGTHRLPAAHGSEEAQCEELRARQAEIDDCEAVIGEFADAFADDADGTRGAFTRDRQPKAAAFELRGRWNKLDARTHKF